MLTLLERCVHYIFAILGKNGAVVYIFLLTVLPADSCHNALTAFFDQRLFDPFQLGSIRDVFLGQGILFIERSIFAFAVLMIRKYLYLFTVF